MRRARNVSLNPPLARWASFKCGRTLLFLGGGWRWAEFDGYGSGGGRPPEVSMKMIVGRERYGIYCSTSDFVGHKQLVWRRLLRRLVGRDKGRKRKQREII